MREGGEKGERGWRCRISVVSLQNSCRLGEIGRHKGLKIPRAVMFVPVRFRQAVQIGKYLLKLIPCRKSNWSHEGSSPFLPTIFLKNAYTYNHMKHLMTSPSICADWKNFQVEGYTLGSVM